MLTANPRKLQPWVGRRHGESRLVDDFFMNKPVKLLKPLGRCPISDKTNPMTGMLAVPRSENGCEDRYLQRFWIEDPSGDGNKHGDWGGPAVGRVCGSLHI